MITLDDKDEWLVRNALAAYGEVVRKCERDARRDARAAGPTYKASYEHLAETWRETGQNIDKLVAKLDLGEVKTT